MRVLIPVYGRVYQTFQEVSDSYAQGFNFRGDISCGFKLCSCRNFIGESVELRFGEKLQFETVVKVHEQETRTEAVNSLNRI